MSEQKRKLEQDFKRLSNLCLELDAEKNDLKAKYEKVNDILLRLKNSLLTAEFNKELRDYYLNKMSDLGEK